MGFVPSTSFSLVDLEQIDDHFLYIYIWLCFWGFGEQKIRTKIRTDFSHIFSAPIYKTEQNENGFGSKQEFCKSLYKIENQKPQVKEKKNTEKVLIFLPREVIVISTLDFKGWDGVSKIVSKLVSPDPVPYIYINVNKFRVRKLHFMLRYEK